MPEKQVRSVTSVIIPRNYGEGDGRKFVMVKERESGLWCPPGGRIDGTDYDVFAAATREVEEEKILWMKHAHEHAVKRGWSEAHELFEF